MPALWSTRAGGSSGRPPGAGGAGWDRGGTVVARGAVPRRGARTGRGAVLGQPGPRRGDHRLGIVSGRPDLVLAALHWVEYVGLLGGIGSMVIRRLARNGPRIGWADPRM